MTQSLMDNQSKEIDSTNNGLTLSTIRSLLKYGKVVNRYLLQYSLTDPTTITGIELKVFLDYPSVGLIPYSSYCDVFTAQSELQDVFFNEVLAHTLPQIEQWDSTEHKPKIIIQIARESLNQQAYVKLIQNKVDEFNVDRTRLQLLIDFRNKKIDEDTKDVLFKLELSGFQIAALVNSPDDIWKNKSGEQMPFNEIRLCGKKVINITKSTHNHTLTRKVVYLGHELNIPVSVDRVLSSTTSRWLESAGFDFVSGPHFCNLLDGNDVFETLTNNERRIEESPDKLNLTVIESESNYQLLFRETLANIFNLTFVTPSDSEQLLQQIDSPPDLLLIDLENIKDGLALIKTIRRELSENKTTIVLLSSDPNPNKRIDAYAAGADELINKPFLIPEFIGKMGRLASFVKTRKKQDKERDQIQFIAHTSMQEAAHYGGVIKLIRKMFTCHDEKKLAQEFFNFMNNKGLNCSIQFSSWEHTCSFDAQNTTCSPIELNIYELLKNKGRLYEFGKRIIVNDNHVSFLIKNLPDNDIERGQIRDYIAIIIECIESRFHDILKQRALQSVFHQLSTVTEALFKAVEKQNNHNEKLEQFSLDLQMSYHVLDLTSDQEAHLNNIIHEMLKAKDAGEIDAKSISNKISVARSSIECLIDDSDDAPEEDNDEFSDDIELF